MFKVNNKGYRILTPNGYQKFSGVQKMEKKCVSLDTKSFSLSCSINHPICVDYQNTKYKIIDRLNVGDCIFTQKGYEKIENIQNLGERCVYDIVGVENSESYYSNGILSHNCEFLDDGSSGIDAELFDELKSNCQDPKIILKDGHYKLWAEPDPSRIYVAGVDVSEGVDQDASVVQVLDITDLREIEQVAVYHNNKIAPAEFSNELHEILQHWGNPLVLIERNNQGAQVCDRLDRDFLYPNIVSWGAKLAHKNQQVGMLAHTNTKNRAVLNERYFINEVRSVKFNDINTLNEFKNFVRYPNGSWKAKGGEHDDRVMSFIWALMILYNEITEIYFEIVELDDFGKPLKLQPMDFGTKLFTNPTSIYTNETVDKIEHSNIAPIAFGAAGEKEDDIADLMSQGWYFPGGSPHQNPDMDISQDQWDSIDKYFG